jgi:hypothetical protein
MDAGPKDVVDRKVAAVADQTMLPAIVVQEIVVPKGGVAARVADRVGRMARRDRRIRSGSSIASMKTKMVR